MFQLTHGLYSIAAETSVLFPNGITEPHCSLMPATTSHSDAGADTETSFSGRARFDHGLASTDQSASGLGGDHKSPAKKTPSSMASTNKSQTASQPEGGSERADHTDRSASRTGKSTQSQEGLLQVPRGGNRAASRPVETSIWDWDIPLESVAEPSASYLYEPQGELLQEQRDQRPLKGEYSIPSAVRGSASTWSLSRSGRPDSSDGFLVSRRLTGDPLAPAGVKRKSTSDQLALGSKQAEKRATRTMSDAGEEAPTSPADSRAPAQSTRSHSGPATRSRAGTDAQADEPINTESLRNPATASGSSGARRAATEASSSTALPARKVFPIQIGDRLFRLSGASISSDAPSYFSQFFEEQLRHNEGADNVRTLYIDRDPATFEDISLHLQGYHVEPRDGPHFVKLFADAQFFSLPRLTAQLFSSTIYIRIGDVEFQIPRDLFSNPGDSPNYFSLGFSTFFTTPNEVFPGLSERTLLRPPSILPPSVPNKSAQTFADLLHILKGYPVTIRSEEHRQELLRDARYFHLKGLEQRIIPHQISYNLARKRTEILIRLEDIRQSGVSFVGDSVAGPTSAGSEATSPTSTTSNTPAGPGWICYQRPYVDSEAYSLIVEIAGEENTFLTVEPAPVSSTARICRARFYKQTLSRITSLFSVIASKMNLPITQPLGLMMLERGGGVASLPVSPGNTGMSEEKVKCRIGPDADVQVNGKAWSVGGDGTEEDDADDDESAMDVDTGRSYRAGSKRRRQTQQEESADSEEWVVRKAQWRLRVQPISGTAPPGRSGIEIILGAVKIEAFSNERCRNASRGFLT